MKDQLDYIEEQHNIEMEACPMCDCTDNDCEYCHGSPIYPQQAASIRRMLNEEDYYYPENDIV